MNSKRNEDAIKTLQTLNGCTTVEALDCMNIAAHTYLRLNEREKAQTAAELYMKYAKTPVDRSNAQIVLNALKQPPGPRSELSGESVVKAFMERPGTTIVKGQFTGLVCGAPNQIVLETESGTKRFTFDDLKAFPFIGPAASIHPSCGAQKPAAAVEVAFAPPSEGSSADGIAKALHFLP
jgi:hypothetical protein